MEIKLKRIYEPKEEADGFRILVDRLYPRGIKKRRLTGRPMGQGNSSL